MADLDPPCVDSGCRPAFWCSLCWLSRLCGWRPPWVRPETRFRTARTPPLLTQRRLRRRTISVLARQALSRRLSCLQRSSSWTMTAIRFLRTRRLSRTLLVALAERRLRRWRMIWSRLVLLVRVGRGRLLAMRGLCRLMSWRLAGLSPRRQPRIILMLLSRLKQAPTLPQPMTDPRAVVQAAERAARA